MIICAPDMSDDVAARFGVEPCIIVSLSRDNLDNPEAYKVWRFADVGLAMAKLGGVPLARYLTLIKRARAHWAVVPDKFADFRATLASWFRYSRIIAKYTTPVFVIQEFYMPRILDAVLELRRMYIVERIALPMRQHPDVLCSREQRLCAERAERVLRVLCGAVSHIHLLGPALRAVKLLRDALRQCERQGTLVSFDTSAYRRSPNSELKRWLGGRWMPRNKHEAMTMLEAWLRQALL